MISRAAVAAGVLLAGWAIGTGARADTLPLPAPQSGAEALPGLGLRTDQLLASQVPGPVSDHEDVTVGLLANGTAASVSVRQQLTVTGTGGYVIRERGPARSAQAVGLSNPPVLNRGTVLWQGFSPGRRSLAAVLRLDPALERARLPLGVRLAFTTLDGHAGRLLAGGRLPGPGTVTIQVTNRTALPVALLGGRAAARPLGAALTRLLTAARRPGAAAPPTAGRGLPVGLPGSRGAPVAALVSAPLAIRASIRSPGTGARLAGPGTRAAADGGSAAGILDAGNVTFTLQVPRGGGRLLLDLTATPRLDPRLLAPPGRLASWRRWATTAPSPGAVRQATATLMAQAATAARCVDIDRYLGADLPGPAAASFRYVLQPPPPAAAAARPLRTKPLGVTLALVALGLIATDLGLLWRLL